MAKYFYTNTSGQKEGPVCRVQLQELAAQGIVEPDTKVLLLHENGGAITDAKCIPELSFNSDSQDREAEV